jgi:Skp family chaperone for outer membrane proteins
MKKQDVTNIKIDLINVYQAFFKTMREVEGCRKEHLKNVNETIVPFCNAYPDKITAERKKIENINALKKDADKLRKQNDKLSSKADPKAKEVEVEYYLI